MFVPSRVSRSVLATAAALTSAPAARAGSFLQPPATWQVIQSLTVTNSQLSYNARGALVADQPYRRVEAAWLVQYGLSGDVTLIARPVALDVQLSQPTGIVEGRGLSSFEAGARWRLTDFRGGVVSFEAAGRASARSDALLAFETSPGVSLRLGYGAPALINGKDGFIDASVAWIKRRQAQVDEVKFETTYGWRRRHDQLMLVQYVTTLYPGSGLRRDPWQRKIQTSTVYGFGKVWSLQVGGFASYGGRQTRRERGTVVALWRSF